ncbi:bleomycin resistance protein [Tessaracoccus terricola]
MTDRAIPNLPSRDFDATSAFYLAFGFRESYRSVAWLILRRGDLQLEFFLFPGVDPATSSAMCTVRVADVDSLYREIRDSGVPEGSTGFPRLHPVRMQDWGMRAGYLVDIDGTQLALVEDPG